MKDDTLKLLADRIKARAVRRVGEILEGCPPQRGGDMSVSGKAMGAHSLVRTRTAVARAAGLSSNQQAQAVCMARVPAADFESAVESAQPPSVTSLAKLGRRPAPASAALNHAAPSV
jgi:hypothetical protein